MQVTIIQPFLYTNQWMCVLEGKMKDLSVLDYISQCKQLPSVSVILAFLGLVNFFIEYSVELAVICWSTRKHKLFWPYWAIIFYRLRESKVILSVWNFCVLRLSEPNYEIRSDLTILLLEWKINVINRNKPNWNIWELTTLKGTRHLLKYVWRNNTLIKQFSLKAG